MQVVKEYILFSSGYICLYIIYLLFRHYMCSVYHDFSCDKIGEWNSITLYTKALQLKLVSLKCTQVPHHKRCIERTKLIAKLEMNLYGLLTLRCATLFYLQCNLFCWYLLCCLFFYFLLLCLYIIYLIWRPQIHTYALLWVPARSMCLFCFLSHAYAAVTSLSIYAESFHKLFLLFTLSWSYLHDSEIFHRYMNILSRLIL